MARLREDARSNRRCKEMKHEELSSDLITAIYSSSSSPVYESVRFEHGLYCVYVDPDGLDEFGTILNPGVVVSIIIHKWTQSSIRNQGANQIT